MLEQFIFCAGEVAISHSVARFGYTTYAISAIESARIDPPRSRIGLKIFGAIFTLLAAIFALDFACELYKRRMLTLEEEEFGALLLGLAGIGIALIWTSTHRGPYCLVFNDAVIAYASADERELLEIKRAIEYAINTSPYGRRARLLRVAPMPG